MPQCCYCKRIGDKLCESAHYRRVFCDRQCRDAYACATHHYMPHSGDRVLVPIASPIVQLCDVLHATLLPVGTRLDDYRHPTHPNEYVLLPRAVTEPIGAALLRIGVYLRTGQHVPLERYKEYRDYYVAHLGETKALEELHKIFFPWEVQKAEMQLAPVMEHEKRGTKRTQEPGEGAEEEQPPAPSLRSSSSGELPSPSPLAEGPPSLTEAQRAAEDARTAAEMQALFQASPIAMLHPAVLVELLIRMDVPTFAAMAQVDRRLSTLTREPSVLRALIAKQPLATLQIYKNRLMEWHTPEDERRKEVLRAIIRAYELRVDGAESVYEMLVSAIEHLKPGFVQVLLEQTGRRHNSIIYLHHPLLVSSVASRITQSISSIHNSLREMISTARLYAPAMHSGIMVRSQPVMDRFSAIIEAFLRWSTPLKQGASFLPLTIGIGALHVLAERQFPVGILAPLVARSGTPISTIGSFFELRVDKSDKEMRSYMASLLQALLAYSPGNGRVAVYRVATVKEPITMLPEYISVLDKWRNRNEEYIDLAFFYEMRLTVAKGLRGGRFDTAVMRQILRWRHGPHFLDLSKPRLLEDFVEEGDAELVPDVLAWRSPVDVRVFAPLKLLMRIGVIRDAMIRAYFAKGDNSQMVVRGRDEPPLDVTDARELLSSALKSDPHYFLAACDSIRVVLTHGGAPLQCREWLNQNHAAPLYEAISMRDLALRVDDIIAVLGVITDGHARIARFAQIIQFADVVLLPRGLRRILELLHVPAPPLDPLGTADEQRILSGDERLSLAFHLQRHQRVYAGEELVHPHLALLTREWRSHNIELQHSATLLAKTSIYVLLTEHQLLAAALNDPVALPLYFDSLTPDRVVRLMLKNLTVNEIPITEHIPVLQGLWSAMIASISRKTLADLSMMDILYKALTTHFTAAVELILVPREDRPPNTLITSLSIMNPVPRLGDEYAEIARLLVQWRSPSGRTDIPLSVPLYDSLFLPNRLRPGLDAQLLVNAGFALEAIHQILSKGGDAALLLSLLDASPLERLDLIALSTVLYRFGTQMNNALALLQALAQWKTSTGQARVNMTLVVGALFQLRHLTGLLFFHANDMPLIRYAMNSAPSNGRELLFTVSPLLGDAINTISSDSGMPFNAPYPINWYVSCSFNDARTTMWLVNKILLLASANKHAVMDVIEVEMMLARVMAQDTRWREMIYEFLDALRVMVPGAATGAPPVAISGTEWLSADYGAMVLYMSAQVQINIAYLSRIFDLSRVIRDPIAQLIRIAQLFRRHASKMIIPPAVLEVLPLRTTLSDAIRADLTVFFKTFDASAAPPVIVQWWNTASDELVRMASALLVAKRYAPLVVPINAELLYIDDLIVDQSKK